MSTQNTDFASMANTYLAEANLGEQGIPPQVRDAVNDAKSAVQDVLAVTEQVTSDLQDLDAKKDLVPLSGLKRLRREATKDAETKLHQAQRRFDQSHKAAESALIDAAQPTLGGSDRELLARDSIRTAIGDATGPEFKARLLGLTESGADPEALAAVNTNWFRSFAISRKVEGVDKITATVKKVAAQTALERDGSESEQIAGAALRKLGGLHKAQAAALAAFRHAFPS